MNIKEEVSAAAITASGATVPEHCRTVISPVDNTDSIEDLENTPQISAIKESTELAILIDEYCID